MLLFCFGTAFNSYFKSHKQGILQNTRFLWPINWSWKIVLSQRTQGVNYFASLKIFTCQGCRAYKITVRADLYHAKHPGKPRIVWLHKINMPLFIFLLAFGAGIGHCISRNKAWYKSAWRNFHFITWIGFVLSIHSLAQINHAVFCYSCMSMKIY